MKIERRGCRAKFLRNIEYKETTNEKTWVNAEKLLMLLISAVCYAMQFILSSDVQYMYARVARIRLQLSPWLRP